MSIAILLKGTSITGNGTRGALLLPLGDAF